MPLPTSSFFCGITHVKKILFSKMFDFEFIVKKIKKVTVQNDFNTIEKYFWYIFVYISWILSDSLKSIKKFKISGNFFLVVETQKLKKKYFKVFLNHLWNITVLVYDHTIKILNFSQVSWLFYLKIKWFHFFCFAFQ